MRAAWITLGLILAYLAQVSFFGAAHLLGVTPNILLVAIILLVPVLAPAELVGAAAGVGFVLDLQSGTDFGLRTAFFVMAAMALLVFRSAGVDSERPATATLLILGALMLYNLAVAGGLLVAGNAPSVWDIVRSSLLELGLCLLCALIIRPWASWLRADPGSHGARRRHG